jgi:hypothetical protein
VRGIRRYVGGLRAPKARAYCISRIVDEPGLKRSRRYYLDDPDRVADGRLSVNCAPFGNIAVCAKFFAFAIGKSTNFLYQPSHLSSHMCENLETNIFRTSPKENAIVIFMKDIAQYYQLSPDKDFVFLPFPKRSVLHDIYMDQASENERCHRAFFLSVWRENALITHIKLRKHLLFALCDTCVDFRDLQMVHHSTADRLLLKKAQLAHHTFVKMERQLYYYRRAKGGNPLDDSMSMIVDAADQQKYALPYHHIATHSSQKAIRVPVHLMGVLIHGEAVHAYTYFENFKQGNNVTIQAIHDSLADKLARDGKLPSTLYIQLDNTSKQCKGRYMIGWLGYLIKMGVFKNIVLSFLPVGHTHEDIDQIFSRLSVYLACHDALNLDELHEAIRGGYQTKDGHRAKCEFWDRCGNFSEWIKPYLTNYDGISRFRQFRFYMKDGVAQVQARTHTSQREEWAGIRGQDAFTKVFKSDPPSRMEDVPVTQRRELVLDAVLEKQKKSIAKLAEKRHIDLEMLDGVMAGVDSLGDPDDLPFNWDLSRLLNWDVNGADEMVEEKVPNVEEEEYVYDYELDTIVLLKAEPGELQPFWLGKVVNLGEGDREGEYEIWWMTSTTAWGTYKLAKNARRKPLVDWVWAASVQDEITMKAKGTKIDSRSAKEIRSWILRWEQDKNAESDDLEPDEAFSSDNNMDLD